MQRYIFWFIACKRWNHTMLDFLNDSMHAIMPVKIYARIHSCIERCIYLHDFYIYYGLLYSLLPCMHQSKEIIANFIVICQTLYCMHQSKHSSMHACVHAYHSKNRVSCDFTFLDNYIWPNEDYESYFYIIMIS